jgi:hypothetical protein
MRLETQTLKKVFLYSDADHTKTIQAVFSVVSILQNEMPQVEFTLWCKVMTSNSQFSQPASKLHLLQTGDGSYLELIHYLNKGFDAAILLTSPTRSPYAIGYLCLLAGIPIRIGQSQEFGGGILTHWIHPPVDSVSFLEYQLHLLKNLELKHFEFDISSNLC